MSVAIPESDMYACPSMKAAVSSPFAASGLSTCTQAEQLSTLDVSEAHDWACRRSKQDLSDEAQVDTALTVGETAISATHSR
jgi:hypothetical protein